MFHRLYVCILKKITGESGRNLMVWLALVTAKYANLIIMQEMPQTGDDSIFAYGFGLSVSLFRTHVQGLLNRSWILISTIISCNHCQWFTETRTNELGVFERELWNCVELESAGASSSSASSSALYRLRYAAANNSLYWTDWGRTFKRFDEWIINWVILWGNESGYCSLQRDEYYRFHGEIGRLPCHSEQSCEISWLHVYDRSS